ncbi:hypothetical protein P5673_004133 [Acropora cervicornis]|uniref:DUF7789 domain-containing protein n=1 Tax=Acropora cervicornis TaxID=6130 RepID=A0AAD9R1Z5_ACRCE|nr:hypothetical protein P5673_004133 [Acropora cervicornis]
MTRTKRAVHFKVVYEIKQPQQQSERLVHLKPDDPDFTFAIIVLINIGFCLFYAIHGVLREREFELYAYIGAITAILVYIVIDLAVNESRTRLKWGRFGAIICLGPPNIYFAIKVAQDFGYLAFRTVGASEAIHRMYRCAGRFSCLLKFDLQLAVSLSVLVITNVTKMSDEAKITVSVGVPLQLFWSILGWLAIINDWQRETADGNDVLIYSFLGAAVAALLVRALLLYSLRCVVNNFGKGLKEQVFNLPITGEEPPIFPRKRDTAECCGIIWRGPLG